MTAEMILSCPSLDPSLTFFTERLGFRLQSIYPADAPAVAVIAGHGLRLRLQTGTRAEPGNLLLITDDPDLLSEKALTAPNGTKITIQPASAPLAIPALKPAFVVSAFSEEIGFSAGRAGMGYRDLVPSRLGGRFIASHIRIDEGGPVPDYVHFHEIRFQMIYCYKGWVKVVYEDQGDPITMRPGDCVLQPPEIRHQVLECSDGMEVIEIGCPAEHVTRVEQEMTLPTTGRHPERNFGGQRFVFHQATKADSEAWRTKGFKCRDLGIGRATDGLAGARVFSSTGRGSATGAATHQAEFLFWFLLSGSARLHVQGEEDAVLRPGTAVTIPGGRRHGLEDCSADMEILEVTLPATIPLRQE